MRTREKTRLAWNFIGVVLPATFTLVQVERRLAGTLTRSTPRERGEDWATPVGIIVTFIASARRQEKEEEEEEEEDDNRKGQEGEEE